VAAFESGDVDEFGEQSRYPSPASVIGKLIKDGTFGNSTAPPFYAVNFGARDGKGSGGNTDPTWELFAKQGFHGLAVEADGVFWTELNKNLEDLPVETELLPVTPDNAVAIIKDNLPRVDVFKVPSFPPSLLPCLLLPPTPAPFLPPSLLPSSSLAASSKILLSPTTNRLRETIERLPANAPLRR
jgi:hypothetical protein